MLRERVREWLTEHPAVTGVLFIILGKSVDVLDVVGQSGGQGFNGP